MCYIYKLNLLTKNCFYQPILWRAGGIKSAEARRAKKEQNEANEANASILKTISTGILLTNT